MKEQRRFGMTARRGTVLAGAFSILATHLYLIFEGKHLAWGNCTDPGLPGGESSGAVFRRFVVCWSLAIVLFLSLVTLAVSGFLLYSVYAQVYRGLLLYVSWIVLYEAANLAVQILTSGTSAGVVRVMRWFGLVARASLHCFWLSFVVTYARLSYKSQPLGDILSYSSRRGSAAARRLPRKQ
ncbi:transmembrane protein 217 isoform X3 [Fukomys damarensis]|uniref:Transmembrane protein 217 n=1 Tax=Fukomys damarensis TaxID=885580 RepID=A0A091D9N6_FUKDA|nr:transmembrane protein 217 isoform X3 [Fukomys damarensis]XP_010637146.1 transmembrane protein 217 isoform X3 [Fukomys damarensis]XP_010637147.1 transmembrane protein 217 isoform X3 [Fukomys damarensis]KFO26985.1 Transmembrane protein 217 [Fukomys damarensis]